MKITEQWDRFELANVPADIRQEILKTLQWFERYNSTAVELLGLRLINIYLLGVREGLASARRMNAEAFDRFGKGK